MLQTEIIRHLKVWETILKTEVRKWNSKNDIVKY